MVEVLKYYLSVETILAVGSFLAAPTISERSKGVITLSEIAADKLKQIIQEEGKADNALRVTVAPTPQGGAQYALSLDDALREDDTVIQSHGVRILVDAESLPLIQGSEIDYMDGLMHSGFVINNPNFLAESGCACGGNCGCGGHH